MFFCSDSVLCERVLYALFDLRIADINVSAYKSKCRVSFKCDIINMIIPPEIVWYFHTEVFHDVNMFQQMAMQSIWVLHWVLFSGYTNGFTFVWTKLHLPGLFPFYQFVQVSLEFFCILHIPHSKIGHSIISK